MFMESLTARKQPSHKLVFDNGQEIDLSQAGLISQARPIQQPLLKSPMKGRNLNYQTISVTSASNYNRTPMSGLRLKAASIERDDPSDDPLQRMVNLQKDHSMGSNAASSRLRARNTSAHIIDYQLKKKLRYGVDAVIEQESIVTSKNVQHFSRGSRSLPRGSVVNSNMGFSDQRSQAEMPNLPQIEGQDRNSRLQMQTPFMRKASQISADKNNVSDQDAMEQSLLQRQISPLGLGSNSISLSQYNTNAAEIIAEKREDIQTIITRQRKAVIASFVRSKETSGNPIMTAYIGRQQMNKKKDDVELELPDISSPINRDNSKEIPGFDKEQKVQEENNTASPDPKAKAIGQPAFAEQELETTKRARNRGAARGTCGQNKKQLHDTEVKDDKLARSPNKLLKKINGNHLPNKTIAKSPDFESIQEFEVFNSNQTASGFRGGETSESIFDEAIRPVEPVDPEKVATEMLYVTDQIMIAPIIANLKQIDGSGDPVLVSDLKSPRAQLISPQIKGKSSMKLSFGQSGMKAGKTAVQFAGIDQANATARNTVTATESNSQAFQSQLKRSNASNLSKSERASSPETNLSSKYRIMVGHVGKRTAQRIQSIIKSGRKVDLAPEDDYIRKHLEENQSVQEEIEDQTVTDSSLRFQRQKEDGFNSQMDLYSEIQSVSGGKKRHCLIKPSSIAVMKAIPAEDSAEERGSEINSQDAPRSKNDMEGETGAEGKGIEEEEQEFEDEPFEPDSDDAAMDEREAYKKKLIDQKSAIKNDQILCGPRLVKKIDDFAFQISIEAGLDLPESSSAAQAVDQNNGNAEQQPRMLQTGYTSLFQIESTKNDGSGQLQKIMDRYIDEFRGQQAFYSQCKMAVNESKWADPSMKNKQIQYYAACVQSNSVAKPILSKIVDKALVLRDLKLNSGDAIGLRETLMTETDLINKLYLDQNSLDGNQLALIVEGFSHQKQLVNLTIQGSTVNEKAVEQISIMLKRKVPDHLQELHLIHAKAVWRATDDLVRSLSTRNYIRKLSLVEAGLNDFSMTNLCTFVRTNRTLTYLDISWNQLTPVQMRPLLVILKKNRRITDINLAWNNIQEAKYEHAEGPNLKCRETIVLLGKFVKHSNTLTHINLTGTGLSAPVIYEFGTFLRRARAVQVVHLSGNPGLTPANLAYLPNRIKCRPIEDIERFTRLQALVKGALRAVGSSNNIINGIKHKIEREQEFNQVHKKDPIQFSVSDQLIFQRQLGHKQDMLGSGQWFESSKNSVACIEHYKNNCYVCDGHIYCILFWSKGMCHKMNVILNKEKTQEIRFEIDHEFGQQEDADIMYENTNVKYSQLEDQVPFVCGSFTGWRYRRMTTLEEFNEKYEPREDAFELACAQGQIRKRVARLDQCNELESRYVEIARIYEKVRLTYCWRSIFSKKLRYKRPFLINSQHFHEQPSEDGTLPENDLMGDILSDTSSDDESEKQRAPSVQEVKIKLSSLTPYQQAEIKQREEEKKRNPLPALPDESKFDKVFVLPVFIRPGKHHYMVKYKDAQEPRQAHLLKKIRKQERRYHAAKQDPQAPIKPFNKQKYREQKTNLTPECFFYQIDVPKRTEEVPIFSKPMKTKVVERLFQRDLTMFKSWRVDTPAQLAQACGEDLKLWKGYRFIKSEDDRADAEEVLKKFYGPLKEIFYFLAANSSWPNVTSLDFCDFTSKAKILDNAVNISSVDRTYIAATLKVMDSKVPCLGLRRFEFLEILVRLANVKYLETKIVRTYAEAIEKLIKECVMVNFKVEAWQPFRDDQLWTIDVNDIFDANQANLKMIYAHYKTPTNGYMELANVIEMCTQDAPLSLSEKEISFCYGYSHMTIVNEERSWKKYLALDFVEFLEFLGRLSHARFKNSSAELAATPLAQKLEGVLDDLFAGFNMQRNEVNIEVEEFSESDEDY